MHITLVFFQFVERPVLWALHVRIHYRVGIELPPSAQKVVLKSLIVP